MTLFPLPKLCVGCFGLGNATHNNGDVKILKKKAIICIALYVVFVISLAKLFPTILVRAGLKTLCKVTFGLNVYTVDRIWLGTYFL